MYCQHFGFHKSPFKITPDPELFFPGGNRGAVLDALVYALSRGEGIVKVVGEVGSGKTMLCRMLAREIPANCEMIYLANPNLGPDEILPAIAYELKLELPPGATKPMVMHALHDYLLAKHADNRRVVMFVEEAQGMPLATLEELRLLSNLETAQDKLLQIVLFGQPELDTKLAQHEIRQLNERITYRFRLAPFVADEIRDYLNARLQASGYRGPELFTRRAIRVLARCSQGLLRRINVLADKALLAAYSSGAPRVLPRHVTRAAEDSEFSRTTQISRGGGFRWAGLTTAVLLASAGTWQYVTRAPDLVPLTNSAPVAPPTVVTPAPSSTADKTPTVATRYTDLTALSLALTAFDLPLAQIDPEADSVHLQRAFNRLARVTETSGEVLLLGAD
jgi:MSHA biogenesis protein MshM